MTLQKKQVELFSHTVEVGTGVNGLYIFHTYLNHEGKINHKIFGNFTVTQKNSNQIHDVKFYVLSDEEFINWFFDLVEKKSTYLPPPSANYQSGKTTDGKFTKGVSGSVKSYFVFDNRFSTLTIKEVYFQLIEEWEEEINLNMDMVTTIPPYDKSLNEQVTKIIEESKTSLQIISPYIDMSLINELLTMKNNGVIIKLITRPRNEFKGKATKEAFKQLQENMKNNHKTNSNVHSRIIISDQSRILVSSADLTHDSLRAQFNAGIITNDMHSVKKLIEYFDIGWRKSSKN